MGPKKKSGKDQEEDTSTYDLLTIYRKICKELETPISKVFEGRLLQVIDDEVNLPEILINEKIGEFGARAIANALMKTNKQFGYKHVQSIRIWDGDITDEGCRAFQQYITDKRNSSVSVLEFLNCSIGPLGCEFISRMFDPTLPSKINVLTLDYNNFGNAGLFNLMTYLTSNKTLNYLSLSYCSIDENGIKYFDQFLKNTTTLKKFILQGNPLKNPGLKELIGLLYDNVTIDEINLNNILFGNDSETVKSLVSLMGSADNILTYHVKFNFLTFEDFEIILNHLKSESGKHVKQFIIDEKIDKAQFDEHYNIMKNRTKKSRKVKPKK